MYRKFKNQDTLSSISSRFTCLLDINVKSPKIYIKKKKEDKEEADTEKVKARDWRSTISSKEEAEEEEQRNEE